MNKVSWRRILQRAGHEFPNEPGASVVQMREGSQIREQPRAGWAAPAHVEIGLESELKRALDRAARREHEPKATGTPPGWEPIFMAQEMSGRAPVPASMPKGDAAGLKRSSSGGRNILAITVSAAVVGIAFQQISTQWSHSRMSSGVSAVPEATSSASVLYAAGSTNDSQSEYGVPPSEDPQSLQLRPSLTEETSPLGAAVTQDQDAFLKEVEQAARVLATQPKREEASRTPVTPVSAPLGEAGREAEPNTVSGADEQLMLRRARELMERGHISGARLIFEHLASQQSALGAFALAQTYDEKFLKTISVQGLEPDPKLAAKWYRRAAELGSEFAGRN